MAAETGIETDINGPAVGYYQSLRRVARALNVEINYVNDAAVETIGDIANDELMQVDLSA
ncbi:MAG: hypothetical protein R3313_04120 [Candidatus Saccharimonadales bacterium]|nr:hypothetical protein [Candidatus Saccharimonadales bacterium]